MQHGVQFVVVVYVPLKMGVDAVLTVNKIRFIYKYDYYETY